jgi:hypothetical protein
MSMSEVDIAERLRVQETRAQLAAARAGMERQAAQLQQAKAAAAATAAVPAKSSTGIWVPKSRASNTTTAPRFGAAAQQLDAQNEELFPDLATASKILEQQKGPKKTTTTSVAPWANTAAAAPPKKEPAKEAAPRPAVVAEEPTPAPVPTPEVVEAPPPPTTISPQAETQVVEPVKKVATKKKKDLSTFKVGSS